MNKGFTLIELSIVLVIIGLITAGIIGGQSLIHSAQIRSVISDVDRFRVAIATFEMQYDSLPGDLRNAKEYWLDPACMDDGANTCDGDGDGFINSDTGSGYWEHSRFWEHMSLAGLILGEYKGDGNSVAGEVTPESRMGNKVHYKIQQYDYGTSYFNKQGIIIWFSKNTNPNGSVSARDASLIDKKIDDGIPREGFVASRVTSPLPPPPSIPNQCDSGGAYVKENKDNLDCYMGFWYRVAS